MKKGQRKRYFTAQTKLEVVQRYLAGESPSALGREYSIRPTLVHQWVTEYERRGVAGLRGLGRPRKEEALAEALPFAGEADSGKLALVAAQRRIAALEQKIGQQELEIDFFKHALRHLETSRPPIPGPGGTASMRSSERGRSRKAD